MEQFLKTYQDLSADTIDTTEEVSSHDLHLIDPAQEIRGLTELRRYFVNLYENIYDNNLDFLHPARANDQGSVQWEMIFSHPRLKNGQDICVHGASFLKFSPDNKVYFKRDYFDSGSMLYQHLSLLGTIIKSINRRLGS